MLPCLRCCLLWPLGLSMLLYALSMMEAYELLVYNEEYTGKLSTRLLKRLRGIVRRHLP